MGPTACGAWVVQFSPLEWASMYLGQIDPRHFSPKQKVSNLQQRNVCAHTHDA
jgi:hypothetical protein